MAARINKKTLNEDWKRRIRTSMLINRLNDHGLGKIEMSATQIKACEILLRKVTPDLSSTTLDTQNGPLVVELVSFNPDSVPKVGKP